MESRVIARLKLWRSVREVAVEKSGSYLQIQPNAASVFEDHEI